MIKIHHTPSPTNAEIDFLSHKIIEENPEFGNYSPFGYFFRDENDEIIAGCNGCAVFGEIYTDQLWVHPDHRKKGLARKLMDHVHDYGRAEGCTMATLSTRSFQGGLEFYKKLGYVVDFERKGHVSGSSCFFLRKELKP